MRAKSRKDCIFCGQLANSDEDIVPDWLVREVGAHKLLVNRHGPSPRQENVGNLRLKARIVCRTCNNGWMSGLENRVIPALQPMLQNQEITLDAPARAHLSRWAVKMSMVIEHTFGLPDSEMYWSQEERFQFACPPHGRPPETQVFLGTYLGNTWKAKLQGSRSHLTALESTVHVAPMIRSTFVFDRVMLYVTADRYTATTGRLGLVWPPPHFDRLEPLARPREFVSAWPLSRSFGDKELQEFLSGKREASQATEQKR